MLDWLWGHTLSSFHTVMAEVPVGAEVRSPEVHKHLAFAAEGLFRSEARVQYPDWPSGAQPMAPRLACAGAVGMSRSMRSG